ncbi:MAG: IS982 family transposase [Gammaproteobacteria bacterium]|jgi:hypothetical protein|nr:IS982 family transposase [Gammaproteobacteria bacterium]MBT4076914.1 IS982 family transposase [Gammaproteobacteria bacterium]MBT4193225.1 IS982 family transposase [Gammaproteobacteria bacterium]MBT4451064.1 IS982 family transposase [Gammaproteobacteria bacterium]MBT4862120.1 IS982 family transposase [Gammaproteobacteria bacterium]
MSNLQSVYSKILVLLHEIEREDNFLNQIRLPMLSDKELMALSLAAESLGIDSEHFLFKQLPEEIEGRIERSVYNRRVRRLSFKLEEIRQKMAQQISPNSDLYIVDSMPLEVCKFSRAKRSKICSEAENSSPDYGFCAAQNFSYYGYKLHAVCTPEGVIKMFDISKASKHDIHYLNDIQDELKHCVLVGDKGYLSQQWQSDLFQQSEIDLKTPMRKNQLNYEEFPEHFRKSRKRIETLFSQLCDQFMIRRNYAKSFAGIARRVITKITSLTLIQWVNQREGNKLNNLKIVIS